MMDGGLERSGCALTERVATNTAKPTRVVTTAFRPQTKVQGTRVLRVGSTNTAVLTSTVRGITSVGLQWTALERAQHSLTLTG
jgi:hypothetical protein